MGTNGKLSLLPRVLCRNNKDLFVSAILLRPKTFVLTLNKMFVMLKYIPERPLRLCLDVLGMDVFA